MNVLYGDLWEVECDVRCITTNGTVNPHGNIMGGGCAREATERYPWLRKFYGRMIEEHGHRTFLIGTLVMFPVKELIEDKADIEIIAQSCDELMVLADLYGWQRIALPAPGCGLGGLSWDEVRPVLEELLDDRVVIVRYPDEEVRPCPRSMDRTSTAT